MRELCKKCGRCCRIIPVDWENGILLRDGAQFLDDKFMEFLVPLKKSDAQDWDYEYVKQIFNVYPNVQIFSCKYFSEDGVCTNFEQHEFCKFPVNAFSLTPEDCSYAGEIFLRNEAIKQKIRKLKEEIIDYEAQIAATKDKNEINHLKKIIIFHQKFIGKFKFFGSKNW